MPRKKKVNSKIEAMILEGARQAVEIAEGRAAGRTTKIVIPKSMICAEIN
jgi:hypothetical protein